MLETRPWRQGVLTARQLAEEGVPVRFLVDAAMGAALEGADAVVTGADTIAANGDVINKIGTSLLSLCAQDAGVPFHVAAEAFKVDLEAPTGRDVRIEERPATEVLDEPIDGVDVLNPVFDVTPAARVTAIVCDMGVLRPVELADAYRRVWAA